MYIRLFFAWVCLVLVWACAPRFLPRRPPNRTPSAHEVVKFTYPEEDPSLTPQEKIKLLNDKLLDNPADAKTWNDLGVLYATQGQFDVARDAFINAIQIDKTNGDFHRNLGLAFSKLDMHEMAVAEFDAYRRFDSMGGQDYWRLIGGAQLQAGMIDDARARPIPKASLPWSRPSGRRVSAWCWP